MTIKYLSLFLLNFLILAIEKKCYELPIDYHYYTNYHIKRDLKYLITFLYNKELFVFLTNLDLRLELIKIICMTFDILNHCKNNL